MNTTYIHPHQLDHKRIRVHRGQFLSTAHGQNGAYEVLTGEVVVVRNGRIVDLVEAGEWLYTQIWPDATVVAWTDCVLRTTPALDQPSDQGSRPPICGYITMRACKELLV